MALLGLVVANVDLGSELHFLDLDLGLVLTSGLGLHGLLVLELTVVHDLADRRLRAGHRGWRTGRAESHRRQSNGTKMQ